MPELTLRIGDRPYVVACQDGEEKFLEAAAALLDAEARHLTRQMPKLPENRLLLMAGLMLADKTAAIEDQTGADAGAVDALKARIATLEADLELAQALPSSPPEQVSVPYIPEQITHQLAELSAQAEAVADRLDEKLTRDDD